MKVQRKFFIGLILTKLTLKYQKSIFHESNKLRFYQSKGAISIGMESTEIIFLKPPDFFKFFDLIEPLKADDSLSHEK